MSLDLGENLKNIVLAGIGALAITAEKSEEIINELVKKGEITAAEGKALNEELSRKIKKKAKDTADENIPYKMVRKDELELDDLVKNLDHLSDEEIKSLKKKIRDMEAEKKSAREKKEGQKG